MMKENSEISDTSVSMAKAVITVLCILAIIIYRFQGLTLEWTEIVLLAIAVLPWLSSFTSSFKLGKDGIEAVFREIQKAKEEIKEDVKEKTEKLAAETTQQLDEVRTNAEVSQSLISLGAGGKFPVKAESYKSELIEKSADGNDPQKGRWGGESVSNNRKLSGVIEDIPNNKFLRRITLRVESTSIETAPLVEKVTFHLHPTFTRPIIDVIPVDGVAEIKLVAWGAFTVGATTDSGITKLELDLSQLGSKNDDPFFGR